MTRPGIAGRLAAAGGWNLLGQAAPVIGGLVLTPFMIHRLGLPRYGVFAVAMTLVTFLSAFDGGLSASATRFFALFSGQGDRVAIGRHLRSLLAALVALGGLLTLVLLPLAHPVLELIGTPASAGQEGAFLVRGLGLIVGLALVRSVLGSVLQADERFRALSIVNVVAYAVYVTGSIVALASHHGLRALTVVFVAQQLVGIGLVGALALPTVGLGHGWCSREELRAYLAYALRVQVVGVTALVNVELDALVVGVARGVREVGLFNAGALFASQLRSVPLNLLTPVLAALARTESEEPEVRNAQFEHLQRVWVVAVSGWSCAATVGAYFGVRAWLGPDFGTSAAVAAVLMGGYGVNLLTGVLTSQLQVMGRADLEARYGLVGMVINVVLTIALLPAFGTIGVAWGTAVGQVLGSLYLLRLARPLALRSFLVDVPAGPLALLAGGVFLGELAVRGLSLQGIPGLLACTVPAGIGLLVFGFHQRTKVHGMLPPAENEG